jgi:hypothetical protein
LFDIAGLEAVVCSDVVDRFAGIDPVGDRLCSKESAPPLCPAARRASLTARFPGGVSSPTMLSEKLPESQGIFAVWPRAEKGELVHGCHRA